MTSLLLQRNTSDPKVWLEEQRANIEIPNEFDFDSLMRPFSSPLDEDLFEFSDWSSISEDAMSLSVASSTFGSLDDFVDVPINPAELLEEVDFLEKPQKKKKRKRVPKLTTEERKKLKHSRMLARRERKNTREKKRREGVKSLYEELTAKLGLASESSKNKTVVLTSVLAYIRELRAAEKAASV